MTSVSRLFRIALASGLAGVFVGGAICGTDVHIIKGDPAMPGAPSTSFSPPVRRASC
jgi:hypothetical protein